MGNVFGSDRPAVLPNPQSPTGPSSPTHTDIENARKRHLESSASNSPSTPTKEPLPKRKKLKSTSQYIYNALFMNGENSDVTIRSLGREWKLHKVYLKQAGYFQSMFHSQWKEASMEVIDLQIPDDNINEKALDMTLGSLYSEDILICPKEVESILAAASLIQLEGLMQQCTEVMKETVCLENVCSYYKSACMYGQEEVCESCVKWLETNLMYAQSLKLLKEIEPALLMKIISSPDLIVIQIEMDIYTTLKKWLFLRLNPNYTGNFKGLLGAAEKFFRTETNRIFLDSEAGEPYIPIFKSLRLQHIIRDYVSCREVEKDMIIPWSWLSELYRQQWLTMLRVEQSIDIGPKECDKDEFETNGLRCGRLLLRDGDHCWRWNGYNFGLDLLVSYSTEGQRTLSIRRNIRSQRCSASVNLAPSRHIVFRILVTSVDQKGHATLRLTTGNTPLVFEKEEEKIILTINKNGLGYDEQGSVRNWKSYFPLLITATFQLVTSPLAREMVEGGHGIQPLPSLAGKSTPTLGESEIGESSQEDDIAEADEEQSL